MNLIVRYFIVKAGAAFFLTGLITLLIMYMVSTEMTDHQFIMAYGHMFIPTFGGLYLVLKGRLAQ